MSKIRIPTKGYQLINKLREFYGHDEISIELLATQEEKLREAIAAQGLKELPEIASIVKQAKDIVDGINKVLTDQIELPDGDRKAIMGERDAHQFYIDRFDPIEAVARQKSIEDFLQTKWDAVKDK